LFEKVILLRFKEFHGLQDGRHLGRTKKRRLYQKKIKSFSKIYKGKIVFYQVT